MILQDLIKLLYTNNFRGNVLVRNIEEGCVCVYAYLMCLYTVEYVSDFINNKF